MKQGVRKVGYNSQSKKPSLSSQKGGLFYNPEAYYTLISTSTPLGSSSFIKASTVLVLEE